MPLNHIFKNSVVKGTLILTIAGLISKLMGFYYKIFLSGVIGAEGIGLYQLVFPITGIAMAVCSMGIENAISRFCAKEKIRPEYLLPVLSCLCRLLLSLHT